MSALIFSFLGTISLSFICSIMESTILSISPAYISIMEKSGRKAGFLLHNLHAHIDRPLAAILTLNTIANTVGSMLVAHYAVLVYGDNALAIASGVLTFIILIFSEIIPKTLGAVHAKKLAPFAAYLVTFMVYLTLPAVILARQINKMMSIGRRKRTTREEMIAAAEIGVHEGVIHSKESQIIRNLLMLDSIKVADIMTPRSVIKALDMNMTVGEVMEKFKPVRFSRIPVYEDSIDHVKGLLHRYKLMEAVANDKFDMTLKEIMTSIHVISETTSVSAALDQFIKRREHLFLVNDEYGTVTGIVTLEDSIETLLGVEIVDEYDSITDMRQYALEQWRLKKQALGLVTKPDKP